MSLSHCKLLLWKDKNFCQIKLVHKSITCTFHEASNYGTFILTTPINTHDNDAIEQINCTMKKNCPITLIVENCHYVLKYFFDPLQCCAAPIFESKS